MGVGGNENTLYSDTDAFRACVATAEVRPQAYAKSMKLTICQVDILEDLEVSYRSIQIIRFKLLKGQPTLYAA